MTISTTQNRVSYNGNGVTTEFAFPYRFLANEDLLVILVETDGTEVTQVLDTDYTVTGVGTDSSGEVTMIVPPAVGERLVILRQVALTQETDYIEGDPFPAESHEAALDKVTMGLQQMQEQIGRTLLLSPAVQSGVDNNLPNPQVGTVLGWADDGLSLVNRDVADVTVLPPDLLRTGDIGVTVQGYDATLLNASDIGVTVQAYDADTAKTDVAQTYTKGQRGAIVALVDAASITPDMADGNFFSVTLGGNRTLENPTNITPGQSGSFFITQDGSGSKTLSYGSYWDFAGGSAPTLSTAANAVDRLDYVVRTTTSIHAVLTKAWS